MNLIIQLEVWFLIIVWTDIHWQPGNKNGSGYIQRFNDRIKIAAKRPLETVLPNLDFAYWFQTKICVYFPAIHLIVFDGVRIQLKILQFFFAVSTYIGRYVDEYIKQKP